MRGVDAALRRDRAIILAAVVLLLGLAWSYVLWMAADMDMGGMDMEGFRMIPAGTGIMAPAVAPWSAFEFALVLLMWAVMMVAMMTPSVAPMILIHARVWRQAQAQGKPFASTGCFAAGYFAAWSAFSLGATSAQWALERASLLTSRMESATHLLAGCILILAGLYQWTPAKDACLTQCQSPLAFIARHGGLPADALGSLRLGMLHGFYCIGCCWALMALLFAFGIMNVLWIVGLAIFVLLEKVIPAGRIISRIAGTLLIAAGIWFLIGE
jgi:predicted metal-binding membrane protein